MIPRQLAARWFIIRVAVLVKKDGDFVLEKNKDGYYFPIGGRVKAGATSLEAAKREVMEELGVAVESLSLKGIIENFFDIGSEHVQEICFVYTMQDMNNLKLGDEFVAYTIEQIDTVDFRPQIIKEIMNADDGKILHLTVKE